VKMFAVYCSVDIQFDVTCRLKINKYIVLKKSCELGASNE